MEKKIRLGCIGAGAQAQLSRFSRFIQLADECELTALAEVRPGLGKIIQSKFGFHTLYESDDELIEKADVDAYVITQMYTRHYFLLPKLLKLGKPVLTEKPVAYSLEKAMEIEKCVRENNATCMVAYQLRSDLGTKYVKNVMKEWQESGQYGKLNYIRIYAPKGDGGYGGNDKFIDTGEPFCDDGFVPEISNREIVDSLYRWQADKYNWFLNCQSHFVDLLHYYMDEPLKVVFAGKDVFVIVLEGINSGIQVTLEVCLYDEKYEWSHRDEIFFEKAKIVVNRPPSLGLNVRSHVELYKQDDTEPSIVSPVLPYTDPMLSAAKDFLAVCRGEIVPPCDITQGIQDMIVCRDIVKLAYGLDPLGSKSE